MMKQSKHWLTGLLMTAMMLSLTGCTSLSAPTSTQESSSSSAVVSSKTKSTKKHSIPVKNQSTSSSSVSEPSLSTAAESASGNHSVAASSAQSVSAQNQTTTSSATAVSETTNGTSNNEASTAAASSSVNDQVIAGLNQAANLQPENGDQYMTSQTSDGNWQVDIRTSSGEGQDPNVSHLKGIYKYNPTTGQYQQMDPMTGEFN